MTRPRAPRRFTSPYGLGSATTGARHHHTSIRQHPTSRSTNASWGHFRPSRWGHCKPSRRAWIRWPDLVWLDLPARAELALRELRLDSQYAPHRCDEPIERGWRPTAEFTEDGVVLAHLGVNVRGRISRERETRFLADRGADCGSVGWWPLSQRDQHAHAQRLRRSDRLAPSLKPTGGPMLLYVGRGLDVEVRKRFGIDRWHPSTTMQPEAGPRQRARRPLRRPTPGSRSRTRTR